jgi:hypothetical protein
MKQIAESSVVRSRTASLFLLTGLGGVLFLTGFISLGLLAPNYSTARDTISALELTTLSSLQRINFLVFGLLLCTFASGLRLELVSGRGARLIPTLQFIAGLGVIGDALFVHDPLHLICDLIAFNSALLVLFLFAWRFRNDIRWKGWFAYSVFTAIMMMACLTMFGVANHFGGPAGALEKSATAARSMWSALLTVKLLRGARLSPTHRAF